MKVGTLKLDFMMRVKQLDIGNRTYRFKNQPELSAGNYEVYVNGPDVRFVKVIGSTDEAKVVIDEMLKNLRERGDHQ